MKEKKMIKIDGKYYSKTCKCGALKDNFKSKLCNKCGVEKLASRTRVTKEQSNKLINFVEKIRRRNGLASIEDIFVEMIGIYNTYCNPSKLDYMDTNTQLSMMWEHLNRIYERLLNGMVIETFSDNEEDNKRKQWREYRRKYYDENKEKIKEYNKIKKEEYRLTNKKREYWLIYKREWNKKNYEKNKEKIKEKAKEYREKKKLKNNI